MSLWVFGYGSLLWNPGFEVAESRIATLHDYARSFCMLSIHHRGTEKDPGLVLALDEASGKSCLGVALRAKAGTEDATLQMLRERELISSAYFETVLPVSLKDGGTVQAVSYVIDRAHGQYCNFTLEEQARIIAKAVGGRGPNAEYLHNTAAHLSQLGIADADLTWLSRRVATFGA